jgi:predicted DsbA family dithiol-disulfide isomerase
MLEFLQGTKLLTAVQDDMGWASSKGIEGVPFFIVNDK